MLINIFDILGSKINEQVNEHQSAGNYTVKFNAENLPSGVYFYKLVAKDFVCTKKMILVK